MTLSDVRALTFDVFGTVVDWRTTVTRELTATLGQGKGLDADWEAVAARWRFEGYVGGIGAIRRGERPFTTADALHREKLDEILAELGNPLDEAEAAELNRVWHRLDPWPDSVGGLGRLRKRFIVSTLSNGNYALLVNMAKYTGLPWDSFLSADLLGHFKSDPETYLSAARALTLKPGQVMMVAAHKADLDAAAGCGLHTAFVPRPHEMPADRPSDLEFEDRFDINATDFHDLATKLGC
jgi:2-haloacid dehalogenase